MPRATVTRDTERFDLRSCKDGYVVIRRMTYGEKLERQDEMMNMRTVSDGSGSKEFVADIKMLTKKVALQDFARLVVEHNLTDEADQPLNFRNPQHVLTLDPVIGDEIGQYIDKINSFEGTEDLKN